MKKLLLSFVLSIFLISNFNAQGNEIENYRLEESSTTKLTSFSLVYGVKKNTIKNTGENKYSILQERLNSDNKIVVDNFTIELVDNSVKIYTIVDRIKYELEKNLDQKILIFRKNAESFVLNEKNIENLNIKSADSYNYNRLASVLIDTFDQNLPRIDEPLYSNQVERCAEFFNGVGLTGTAASVRAQENAQEFLASPDAQGKNCKSHGVDTSCVLDSHVCWSTVTVSCDC